MGRYAALLLLIVALACSASTPTAPPLHPINTSLTGRVMDAATLTGIRGAIVRIIGPNVDKVVTTTDDAGNYSFIHLSPAVFTVLADAPLHYEQTKTVDLTMSNTLSFELIGGAPSTPSPWDD